MSIRTTVRKMGSANKFIKQVWSNYKKYASPDQYLFDRYIPLLCGCIISFLIVTLIPGVKDILSIFKEFNNAALSVIAILAGFNTASLSVIAASNSKVLGKLAASDRRDAQNNPSNLLTQTVAIFGYSIVSELLILILGALLIFVLNLLGGAFDNFSELNIAVNIFKFIIAMLAIPWIALVFHSLLVSVRNVSILYSYILLIGHEAKSENNSDGI